MEYLRGEQMKNFLLKASLFILFFTTLILFTKFGAVLVEKYTWPPWIALGAGITFLILRLLKRTNSYYLIIASVLWMLYFIYEAINSWQYIPANPQNIYRGDLVILFPILFMFSVISLYDFITAKKRQKFIESLDNS